jgi:hypothetical protein
MVNRVALVLCVIGTVGLLLVPLTKSGLGSCGPYGALGFMTILGPLLLILGAAALGLQFLARLFKVGKP